MNNFLKIVFSAVLLINLTACISPRHICDENCVPICKVYANEQQSLSKQEWEDFKNYKPFRYRRIGDPVIDESMIMYEKISNQIYSEVIIPYIEQDADGSLVEYRAFKKQVEFEMKAKCLNRKQATNLVLEAIREQKPESYGRVLHSCKIIENRDVSKQFTKILVKVSPNLIRLLAFLTAENSRHSSIEMQIIGYVYIGIVLIPEVLKAIEACDFLSEVFDANDKANEEIMKFIKEHEDF